MTISEHLQQTLFRIMMALPKKIQVLLAGGTPVVARENALDPALQLLAHLSAEQASLQDLPINEARAAAAAGYAAFAGPGCTKVTVSDSFIVSPDFNIPVRIFRPSGRQSQAAILYFHPGGWVVGSRDTGQDFCSALCSRSNTLLISVDYLAPENKFPAAVEDAFFAYQWLIKSCQELGVDPQKIVVAGESAGGNLAAVVCQLALQDKLPQPCAQVLISPATDLAGRSSSYSELNNAFPLTAQAMEWFIGCYLENDSDAMDTRASPLLSDQLQGLPPACIITAGFDPLVDEGYAYAKKLKKAGVKVAYHCEESSGHGICTMAGLSRSTAAASNRVLEYVLKQLPI